MIRYPVLLLCGVCGVACRPVRDADEVMKFESSKVNLAADSMIRFIRLIRFYRPYYVRSSNEDGRRRDGTTALHLFIYAPALADACNAASHATIS